MKKILFAAGLLLAAVPASQAQSNVLKLNLPSIFVATGSVFYERQLADNTSAQLGAYVTSLSIFNVKFSGYGITPEFRYYPGGEALHGFFVGPYLRFQQLSASKDFEAAGQTYTGKATLSTFGGGVVLGYQGIIGEHFSIEPFLGLGYNARNVTVDAGAATADDYNLTAFTGVGFRPGLTVGYAF